MDLEDETLGVFGEAPGRTRGREASTRGLGSLAVGEGADPHVGREVGGYRIERLIARGGMGAVYLAARIQDFEQRVALKLVHPHRQTVGVIRRFAAERQILARLEHPHIARLLDGGSTDDSLPFFVMEYVEGRPIDRYCREHDLSLDSRLDLFRKICTAVQFAHQNLVIHRDLKPQNILITDDAVPKLLDFGIAEILGSEISQSGRSMTPDFASPEQMQGEGVTTATDIYSLGVLLYLLLTGQLPRQHPVTLPSLAASDHHRVSRSRQLVGDLDAILLKALSLEPSDRYGSALQFAEDLDRYRQDLPVRAYSGNSWYRLRKRAKRHKVFLAVACLVAGLAVMSTAFWRLAVEERGHAERAQQRAERSQEGAERVAEFLGDLFKLANPDAAQGEILTLRQALDEGRKKLEDELVDDPEVRGGLLSALGSVYNNLGLFTEARELKDEGLEMRRRADPSDRTELATDLNNLGRLLYDVEALEEAEGFFRQALEMWIRLGEDSHVVLASSNLASTLAQQGQYEAALELHSRNLQLRRRLHGEESVQEAASLYGMGAVHRLRDEPEAAEPLLRRALGIYVRHLGADHSKVASVESSLGRVLHAQGLYGEARTHLEKALELRQRLLGPNHTQVLGSRRNLAALLLDQGEVDEAGELLASALVTARGSESGPSALEASIESYWGAYLTAVGRYPEAEPFVIEGYRALREAKGAGHTDTQEARGFVAKLYEAWGRDDEAARYRAASDLSAVGR